MSRRPSTPLISSPSCSRTARGRGWLIIAYCRVVVSSKKLAAAAVAIAAVHIQPAPSIRCQLQTIIIFNSFTNSEALCVLYRKPLASARFQSPPPIPSIKFDRECSTFDPRPTTTTATMINELISNLLKGALAPKPLGWNVIFSVTSHQIFSRR